MALTAGSRLGHVEILSLIGVGGMGEVWRGRDTKLKRDVAIKVLPDAFASNPERLARFQREAEVLAALDHPNIARIHGLHDSDGVRAIIMEYVEGPTLAERVSHGPVPIDEAMAPNQLTRTCSDGCADASSARIMTNRWSSGVTS